MAKSIRVGYDYLHNHTKIEKHLGVPQDHVIVDREDWEEVVRFFNEHPEVIASLEQHLEAIALLKQKPEFTIKK